MACPTDGPMEEGTRKGSLHYFSEIKSRSPPCGLVTHFCPSCPQCGTIPKYMSGRHVSKTPLHCERCLARCRVTPNFRTTRQRKREGIGPIFHWVAPRVAGVLALIITATAMMMMMNKPTSRPAMREGLAGQRLEEHFRSEECVI